MLGPLLHLVNSTMGRNECGVLNGRESHSKAPEMLISLHRVTKIFIRPTRFQKHFNHRDYESKGKGKVHPRRGNKAPEGE